MKLVDWTLANMLHCVYGDNYQNWEASSPRVEFAYNNKVNQSTYKTPFEIVYTGFPHHVHDLAIMPTSVGHK